MEKEQVIKKAYDECLKICDDEFLIEKLEACNEFLEGKIGIEETRKRAFACHKYAREQADKRTEYLARACGHAIATIHVKEHLEPCLNYVEKYNYETINFYKG